MMTLRSVDILVSQIILYSLKIYLNCFHLKYYEKYAFPWIHYQNYLFLYNQCKFSELKPAVYC